MRHAFRWFIQADSPLPIQSVENSGTQAFMNSTKERMTNCKHMKRYLESWQSRINIPFTANLCGFNSGWNKYFGSFSDKADMDVNWIHSCCFVILFSTNTGLFLTIYYFVWENNQFVSRGLIRLHLKLFTIHNLLNCMFYFLLLWCPVVKWQLVYLKYTETISLKYNMKM